MGRYELVCLLPIPDLRQNPQLIKIELWNKELIDVHQTEQQSIMFYVIFSKQTGFH